MILVAMALLLWGQGRLFAAPVVSVSTLPLHSLVSLVMKGVGEPTLLMASGQSPHHQSLLPSTIRKIAESDLVVWVGPVHESSLSRAVQQVENEAIIMTLIDNPQITRLPSRRGGIWDEGSHSHESDDSENHSEGGHGSLSVDGHIWLSTDNAKSIIEVVGKQLKEMDVENKAAYKRNMDLAYQRIDRLKRDLKDQFAHVRKKDYLVFHDAYQYLEAEFDLRPAGVVAISPDRAPSAKTLRNLRQLIEKINDDNQSVCIFREPQFKSSAITILDENNNVITSELDPIGIGIERGSDLWFKLMYDLGAALASCLATKH